jgi:hypothetical protein
MNSVMHVIYRHKTPRNTVMMGLALLRDIGNPSTRKATGFNRRRRGLTGMNTHE